MSADRTLLRRQLRERRRQLPAAQRMTAAESLAERLLALPFATTTGYVAGYWAMDGEIALHAWQLRLPADIVYCLPVLHDDRCLRFAPWRPGDALVANRYGIPEPANAEDTARSAQAMSLIVLPLVGFDLQGHRLGMGAGWYDRTLAFRHDRPVQPPWLVGVGFSFQKTEPLSTEAWDVPLDAICTETETCHFSPNLLSPSPT